MPKQSNAPQLTETAFDCPHCGAYTTQHWYELGASRINDENGNKTPRRVDPDVIDRIDSDPNIDADNKRELVAFFTDILAGVVFLERLKTSEYTPNKVHNVHISKCYNCSKIAIWVSDRLLYPSQKFGVEPNEDLPPEILRDFDEARAIVDLSPRGAAALLRLTIQKLCKHLGENGKNIDRDIASLVEKGLPPKVQKSLDVVRVIGNEAVHPGTIDLKDDREAAGHLFGLVNIIAEQMITAPKHVDAMFESLPEVKRKAIEKRDKKANGS
jgi:hypothetical protein